MEFSESKAKAQKYLKPQQRLSRSITLLKEIACKVLELESSYMKMVLIKRYTRDDNGDRTDTISWDGWMHHEDSAPQRELVWCGKNAHKPTSKDLPFTLFSRRAGATSGGAAVFLVTDTKHGESHTLAVIFDAGLNVTAVRKGDILGNDFRARVSKKAIELGNILSFDRKICEAVEYGDTNKKS